MFKSSEYKNKDIPSFYLCRLINDLDGFAVIIFVVILYRLSMYKLIYLVSLSNEDFVRLQICNMLILGFVYENLLTDLKSC